jgi:PhnB protein
MTQIVAYLNLNGKCEEAMNFYKDCLGAELTLQRVGETPMASQMPTEMHDKVLHSMLVKDTITLMASDMRGKDFIKGNDTTLLFNCSSEEEINNYFNKLSQGGTVKLPLMKQFWGATYGELIDKYGKEWAFNFMDEGANN